MSLVQLGVAVWQGGGITACSACCRVFEWVSNCMLWSLLRVKGICRSVPSTHQSMVFCTFWVIIDNQFEE